MAKNEERMSAKRLWMMHACLTVINSKQRIIKCSPSSVSAGQCEQKENKGKTWCVKLIGKRKRKEEEDREEDDFCLFLQLLSVSVILT